MNDWEDIYNATPCYFFSFSNEGFITRINATLLNDLGYTENEVVNVLKLEDLLTVGSRIFFQTHFYPLIKMQGKVNEIYLSFRSRNNRELPILLNVVLNRRGEIFTVHCGGMQISQRNRFEKELLDAKNVAENALLENHELVQLKKQLEYNQRQLEKQLKKVSRINSEHYQIDKVLSHDLQEPLRKIGIFTSMILEKSDLTMPHYEKITKIGKSVDKIRMLIDSMQKFHSLEYRKFEYSNIQLQPLIQNAATAVTPTAVLRFENAAIPEFSADASLLFNLFEELIKNSTTFIDEGKQSEITIAVSEMMHNIYSEMEGKYRFEPFICIRYTDNGIGFNNEYAGRAFDLCNKLNSKGGLGIGLAFCKKIVHMHLGQISVTSHPGKGSTFTILLPIAPQQDVERKTLQS